MRHIIFLLTISLFLMSCGQNDTKQKELELRERELALKEKEFAGKQGDTTNLKSPVQHTITKDTVKVLTQSTSANTTLSDEEIINFIKKDFSKERNDEQLPSPRVNKVFLLDYNNGGLKDGVAYAIGSQKGAKFSFNGFGLYKNDNGKMRLVDWKVSSISTFESINQSGKNVVIKTTSFAPDDPQCCPSVKKTMQLSFSNDKIIGLQ